MIVGNSVLHCRECYSELIEVVGDLLHVKCNTCGEISVPVKGQKLDDMRTYQKDGSSDEPFWLQ